MAIYVAKNGQLQTIKGIYYGMTENYINATLFHNLVPKTATEIKFLYASNNPDLTDYQKLGYCNDNNYIEVWNSGTKYIIINQSKNYIYAPVSCGSFFSGYTALIDCIFDNFDTSYTTSMHSMFYNCNNLTSLDLSSFNTSNITTLYNCFALCQRLKNLNISSFNTANVTTMVDCFAECNNLTSLNLSGFNTANVTNMQGCFFRCRHLTSLDLSSFNTAKVTNMNNMFVDCNQMRTLIANTFDKTVLANSNNMFYFCLSLVGGNGTTYSSSHTSAEYARVDGEDGLTGYFTAPTN